MQTVTLQVTLPKKLLTYGMGKADINREVGKWLVFSLFRAERVSSGKAASLLGMTRREFLELLHREGIAYFDHSEEDMQAEFASARKLIPAETEQ